MGLNLKGTFTLILLLLSVGSYAQNIVLVRNKYSSYKIIIPKIPAPIEKKAAAELQSYLFQISGVQLPIIHEGNDPSQSHEILVGKTKESSIINYNKIQEDGIAIKTIGTKLFLTGGKRKGILYSVYTFLEDYLGCRKYTCTISYIPKKNVIMIKPISIIQNPAFKFRYIYYHDAFDSSYADWHRLNYCFEDWGPDVHTFSELLPPSVYYKSHPEYFAMVNGQRVPSQPCLSNPEVLNIVIATLRKQMDERPNLKYWSVSQNDNGDYCQCPLCEPKNKRENSYQGTLLPFVNAVAKHFPNKIISTLAYEQSLIPPKDIVPFKNVNIMLCATTIGHNKPLSESQSPDDRKFIEILDEWKKSTSNILLWNYVSSYTYSLYPYPNIQPLQPNIQFFHTEHIPMLFEEGLGNIWEPFSHLKCYLISELMWNPQINVKRTTKEFLRAYYGPAATEIGEYLSLLEIESNKSVTPLRPLGNAVQHQDDYLKGDNVEKYYAILRRAEQETSNYPQYYNRVVRERLALDFAELQIEANDPQRRKQLGEKGLKMKLDKFVRECAHFGITAISEGGETPLEFSQNPNLRR